jgi:hypothetical protein
VLGEEPGLGLPNQHTKACPRFQTMHCWCPPATGPGQPHESTCVQYKRPVKGTLDKKYIVGKPLPLKTGSFFGHGLQYSVPGPLYPGKLTLGKQPPEKYSPIVDPGKWTFGEMAAKIIADAVAAAESASGQGELPAAEIPPEILPEPSVGFIDGFIDFGLIQLSQKEKQSLAYVQAHAMQLQAQALAQAYNHAQQWVDKQKPQSYVHFAPPVPSIESNELCTCGGPGEPSPAHASFCPLGEKP